MREGPSRSRQTDQVGDDVLAEKVYECLFLLDPNQYARDPSGAMKVVDDLVREAGGEILVSRLWAEQKLAYPIQGHRKGTYWLTFFRMPPENVSGFNRACRIHALVLRHLVTKVDPRLVDALVAHARGERLPEEDQEPAGAADSAADVGSPAPAEPDSAGTAAEAST